MACKINLCSATLLYIVSLALCEGKLDPKITYRIKSGYDGTMLTAEYPEFDSQLNLNLGKVINEEWFNIRPQLWKVEERGNDTYWLKPKAAILNKITGVPKEKENIFEVVEITRDSGTYTMRQLSSDKCVENQGALEEIAYRECNELNTAQQWDFEDPLNLRVKIRFFDRIPFLYMG